MVTPLILTVILETISFRYAKGQNASVRLSYAIISLIYGLGFGFALAGVLTKSTPHELSRSRIDCAEVVAPNVSTTTDESLKAVSTYCFRTVAKYQPEGVMKLFTLPLGVQTRDEITVVLPSNSK
jgi:hypothetical protein